MCNVQEQAFVVPLLASGAQLHESCLSHFPRLVGDSPLNVKAHCLWPLLQQLCTVVVNFNGSICIDDMALHAMKVI